MDPSHKYPGLSPASRSVNTRKHYPRNDMDRRNHRRNNAECILEQHCGNSHVGRLRRVLWPCTPTSTRPTRCQFPSPNHDHLAFRQTRLHRSTQYSFESIMKLIECSHNLSSLTARNAQANNLLPALDFNQQPTPTHIVALVKPNLMPLNLMSLCQATPEQAS
jgi:hypothetical protein